eukprot:766202-Lingulodinium_polyedra.AAC.1
MLVELEHIHRQHQVTPPGAQDLARPANAVEDGEQRGHPRPPAPPEAHRDERVRHAEDDRGP